MTSIVSTLCVVCAFLLPLSAHAFEVGDIFRQSSGTIVNTERGKSNAEIDAARRKETIDINTRKQIADLDVLIDANNRRIREDLDPQLMEARIDVHDVERDFAEGMISRSEMVRRKRIAENRVTNLRSAIANLEKQNADYERRKREVSVNADAQKQRVDIDTDAKIDRATTNQNSTIIDQVIKGIMR